MSIDWVPLIIGLLFVVIWLISFQAILSEHGGTSKLPARTRTVSDHPPQPSLGRARAGNGLLDSIEVGLGAQDQGIPQNGR